MTDKGSDPKEFITNLFNWGFQISITGFNGPFLSIEQILNLDGDLFCVLKE